jgi:hypothetical protein
MQGVLSLLNRKIRQLVPKEGDSLTGKRASAIGCTHQTLTGNL